MRKIIIFVAMCLYVVIANAQSQYDVNRDGKVSMADANIVTNVFLGKTKDELRKYDDATLDSLFSIVFTRLDSLEKRQGIKYPYVKDTTTTDTSSVVIVEPTIIDYKPLLNAIYLQFAGFASYEQAMENSALGIIGSEGISINSNEIYNAWGSGYNTISRCNQLIGYTENNSSDSSVKRYWAMAHCFRAMTYYMMTQLWGDIPYVTSFDTQDGMTRVSSSHITTQCIDEMTAFKTMLGTDLYFTENGFSSLLGEMMMSMGNNNWYWEYSGGDITMSYNGTSYIITDYGYYMRLYNEMNGTMDKASLAQEWRTTLPCYGRWIALKRLGKAEATNGMAASLLFPIPQREIELNPAMKQNEGY